MKLANLTWFTPTVVPYYNTLLTESQALIQGHSMSFLRSINSSSDYFTDGPLNNEFHIAM